MNSEGITYVGLHRHSTYSALDGTGTPEQIAERLRAIGQDACGITDHGNIFAHIHCEHIFREIGVRPIFGCEMYHVADRAAHVARKGKKTSDLPAEEELGVSHLTLLAQSQQGYQNLLKLSDLSYREGFNRKPAVDWEDVIQHQEGLVVLSGCVAGMLSRCLYQPEEKPGKNKRARKKLFNLEEGIETATAWAAWLKERIEQFYIEIVPCPGLGISEQSCVHLWKIAQELGIPTVLTDDAHFAAPEDHEAEDTMVCIQTHKQKHDPTRTLRLDKIHYHCTGEGIVERAQKVLPAVSRAALIAAAGRSVEIADRCNVELPRSTGPVFPVPIGLTAKELLEQWVDEGVEYRRSLGLLPDPDTAEWYEYCEREAYELEIIAHHSFENYFLLVADLVRWSEREDRWCVARGSCGGSLICWYLGITQIDPIKWDLPVERFIDKTRPDLPDIDLDFDARYRDEAFRYLEGKYGADRCAQIAALSTFRPRQAVKDVVKVFNNKDYGAERLTEAAGAALIDLLPELDNDGGIKARGLLAQLFRENVKAQDLLQKWPKLAVAAQIEGQIRQQTIHAAGFVVDSRPLTELVGVVTITKGKVTKGKVTKGAVTQRVIACDKDLAARQGFLKIDALSVETMSAIAETLTAIGKDRHWLYALPLDDAGAYDVLARGKSAGLFQFKGHAASKILPQLAPSRFTDLIALAALARPGPIQSGGVREYTERKHGREQTPEFHPAVWEVLRETYGVILYQEQVMGIMRVAGFDWPDVHKIRKLVSKSGGTAALEAYRGAYREGMGGRGVSIEESDHVWIQCQKAGDYVFNKCLTGDTVVTRPGKNNGGGDITLQALYHAQESNTDWGTKIRSGKLNLLQMDPDGRVRLGKLKAVYYQGRRQVYRVLLTSGKAIRGTDNHRLLTDHGYCRIDELEVGHALVVVGEKERYVKIGWKSTATGNSYEGMGFQSGANNPSWIDGRTPAFNLAREIVRKRSHGKCEFCDCDEVGRFEAAHYHSLDQCGGDYSYYLNPDNIRWLCNSCHKKLDYRKGERKGVWSKGLPTLTEHIISIEPDGIEDVYDVEMNTSEHNFIANGIVSHNSHGAAYALLAYWTAYLKCHYPDQFYSLFANHETKEEYRKQLLREYQELGGKIQLLDYNRSGLKFSSPEPGVLLGGFATLHGIGASVGEKLIAGRPYRDWRHFLLKCPNAVGQVLAATGIHTGKLDLDVVLAIAPWFAEVEFLPMERAAFMRMKCHEIGSLLTRMEPKFGGADVRLLGRVTDCEVSPDKRGAGDRCRMTLTDPTGSVDIWFAAWKWGDVEEARDPLRGDAEGLGNTLYVTASLSDDGARLFGEDAILLRQSQAKLTLEARKTIKKKKQNDDATLLVD